MEEKIKVLQVIPDFGYGGAERMAVHLMKSIDRERFEVAAISMFDRMGSDLEVMLEESGIHVWYLGKKLGFDPRMYYRIDAVLRQFRPHIVHTHRYILCYVLPLVVSRRIQGKVHTVHNLAEKEVDALGKLIHRFAFSFGVVPVAIASEVAGSLNRVYGISSAPLIPNGIPLSVNCFSELMRKEWRSREDIAAEEVIFVCVGRLTLQKNQQLLFKAFAGMPNVREKGMLLLIGEGEKRSELEIQAKTMGIDHRVRFMGVRTDIPVILSACDVFVLSSNWEGNPLSVMEAMAAGMPVIATAVGGVPELVLDGTTGFLVPPDDVAALGEAMSALLHDANRRKEMGRAAAKRAEERFCIKVMAKRYEELYKNMLVSR